MLVGAAVWFTQWTLGGARGTDLSGGAQEARARRGVHAAPRAGVSRCALWVPQLIPTGVTLDAALYPGPQHAGDGPRSWLRFTLP